jgi:hypothetical protein
MNFLKSFLLILFILTIFGKVSGQNNCPQTLKKAQDTYDEGRISEVPELLEECLKTKDGFSKAEKIDAYKLLTLTWLYFNERTKAEETMHHFLVLNPEYEINQAIDPTEFINLYNSFRTTPVLIYGIKVGFNGQDVNVIRNFSIDNSSIKRGNYKSPINMQVGLSFEIPLKKKLSLLTELNLTKKNYQYKDQLLEFSTVEFSEKQTLLEVPLLLHFNLRKNKFSPYFNLGGTFSYLLSDKAIVTRKDNRDGTQLDVPGPEIKITDLRHRLMYNLSIGAGFKFKNLIGNGYLILDLRYNIGLRNIVKPENRGTNPELLYNYLYLDNDFTMNSFVFSIGYSLPKYKPKIKKIKHSKTENQ